VTDDTPTSAPDLSPDGVAIALGGVPPQAPVGYVSFKGYLAPSVDGVHRIYLDNSFWKWVEVRAQDIRFRQDVPSNDRDPRSIFWLERQATVTTCQVGLAHEIEDDLWGGAKDDPAAWGRPPY
jgi:hypothetical protein